MTMKVSIQAFLRNGKFGGVEVGMSKHTVLNLLGEPSSDHSLGETGSILLYSWYEFFFDDEDILNYIQNDSYNPEDIDSYQFQNEKFEVDAWFMDGSKNQGIDEVKKRLDQENFEYRVEEYYGREIIKLASGVVVDFDDCENSHGIKELTGIRYFSDAD